MESCVTCFTILQIWGCCTERALLGAPRVERSTDKCPFLLCPLFSDLFIYSVWIVWVALEESHQPMVIFIPRFLLASQGCLDKVSQTRRFKTTEACCLLVLNARSPKSICWWTCSLQNLQGCPLPCFFQLWVNPGGPWLVTASTPIPTSVFPWPPSLCVPVSKSPSSCQDASPIRFQTRHSPCNSRN